MTGKVQWGDLHTATYTELKKTYKVTDRQLETQVRRHLDGASSSERRDMYETVYGKRK